MPHAWRFTVDVAEARTAPGVVAVWTGADLARWCPELPGFDEGPTMKLVATDTVRYVGDPVAVVIARSAADGVDGAELVDVDYDALQSVVDARLLEVPSCSSGAPSASAASASATNGRAS